MLKSRIHRATVTLAVLDQEESVVIDRDLMRRADIWPFERIEIYNLENGARFSSYAIEGNAGSGVIGVTGAAAHLAKPGSKVTISAQVSLGEGDLVRYQPRMVFVDERNRLITRG